MAIPIIGASRPSETQASPLPVIDVDLPPPGTAPEGKRPLSEENIKALLAHANPLVRAYALEQATHLEGSEWNEIILRLIADPDDAVACDAIHSMEVRKYKPAVDAILDRFRAGSREVVAVASSALGELAPERLLEAVKQRGRLDDEAYAATATALACIGSNEVIEFLDNGLNRAGVLSPERRGALYGAALLSGGSELSGRVISLALADSKNEEPEGASYPTRGALAAVAGIPLPYSRRAAGLEVYDHARLTLETDVLPLLAEKDRAALEEALKMKRAGDVLAALRPVLDAPEPPRATPSEPSDYGTMPQRRRGLLQALIARKDSIGELDLNAAAIFLTAAAQAATVVAAGGGDEATSAAMISIAKALETPSIDAAKLASMTESEVTALFADRGERQMRRVLSIFAHEHVRHVSTMRRFARAILDAGHGLALVEAAAEVEDPRVHDAVLRALKDRRVIAEKILLDALSRTPLEPKLATLALTAAEDVRTERLALAIGRRFYDLRAVARGQIVRTVLRLGDPRLIPVIESRAFVGEPEEIAWALLAQIHGVGAGAKLDAAIARASRREPAENEAREVRVPLSCKRCKETLGYGFERILLDIEAKDQFGDPAFVGEVKCKACGADEQLEPTAEAGRILTTHMLEFLQESKRGRPMVAPLVSPAQTEVRGRRMGLAAGLRALEQEIKSSPTAIRPRLHRARLRLVLKRRHLEEDVDVVLSADPRSAEALSLRAAALARSGEHARAMEQSAEALRLLNADPPSRLYDADDADAFRRNVEDYILQLERYDGITAPADLDLSQARVRREELERQLVDQAAEMERAAAAREEEDDEAGAPPDRGEQDSALAEAFQRAGRNDTCPCGSGKKFKKCHGRGR